MAASHPYLINIIQSLLITESMQLTICRIQCSEG